MKKALLTLMCLLAMMGAGTGLKAQGISVTIKPGWTWISYPRADTLDLATALGTFVPMEGDVISCEDDFSEYSDGEWFGDFQQFYPGIGYMYYSNRTEPVTLTISGQPSPVSVTTLEPTDITVMSALVGGTVTINEGNHIFARGLCWSTEPNPTIDGNHQTGDNVAGSQSFTLNDLTIGTTYYVRAYVATDNGLAYGEEVSFLTESNQDEHAYVDLGLPSGLLWATCNVGAEAPEQYGDYFAWGETQPKDTYNSTSYQYSEDDAATANWGNGWRMPTKEEWEELYNNTTSTWTTQNGVNGRLFTANNGNSIFLPAAGYRQNSGLAYAGSYAGYWSSSLYTDDLDNAWVFRFTSGYYNMARGNRYLGLSVRPVRVGSQSTSFIINATANPSEGGEVNGGGTYEEGAECTLTATANEGYSFTNWTENGEVVSVDATYSFTVNGDRNLVANFVVSGGGNHAYVDLGLPSGLLWATCNVGADSPEDYGDYFAWGETQPKDTYTLDNYQYYGSVNPIELTKYCNNSNYGYNGFADDLTILLPQDDAATTNWGSVWRMPTSEEWQELLNNTTNTWTTQNGVNGMLFTASNGNSLFLPAAGYRGDSNLINAFSYGYYWSSSLYDIPIGAWKFYFNYEHYYDGVYTDNRHFGFTVRPVRSASQNTSFSIDATANPTEGGTVMGGGTYEQGQSCTLTATPNVGYTFTNWTEGGEVVSTDAIYTFTVNDNRTLLANFVVSGGGNHAYVDLGLPSGLLWATCNVGANSPEDYGDYFAWGETQPKDTYSWSTYQYCNGSYSTLTKYCNNSSYGYNGFTDNLTTLLPEDDAATANWGSDWRMPTKEEWQELYNYTTVIWTTQNGVHGRLFTAANGNSLFLPAAGHRYGSSLYVAGSVGYYWSSSLYTDDGPHHAWYFEFWDYFSIIYNDRNYGQSVRGVRSSRQN